MGHSASEAAQIGNGAMSTTTARPKEFKKLRLVSKLDKCVPHDLIQVQLKKHFDMSPIDVFTENLKLA